MGTRGRKPHARDVVGLDELLVPDELLLDTSLVYEALQRGQPNHDVCADFLERAASHGTVFYFNRLLEMELRETAFRAAFVRRWGRHWKNRRYDGRTRAAATRETREIMRAWERFLAANSYARFELDEVEHLVDDLMALGLGSYDAVHAATAAFAQVRHIATLDASFALVPDLTIHTDQSRLARCRQTRGARPRRI